MHSGAPLRANDARPSTRPAKNAEWREAVTLPAEQLGSLIDSLRAEGYRVIGPKRRDGAIVYEPIESAGDLPRGWRDVQEPGRYRLERSDDGAYFAFNHGADSAKRWLHVPREQLFRAERDEAGKVRFISVEVSEGAAPVALFGVRGCDLAGIAALDDVLRDGEYPDARYAHRRRGAFVVAVNCTRMGGTCFCPSFGTGPAARRGFDLALTELDPGSDEQRFLVEIGTTRGARLLEHLELPLASAADREAAALRIAEAEASARTQLDTAGLAAALATERDAASWDAVADRCLACANCTMVCPTCFCSTTEDESSFDQGEASRSRRWDSCFSPSFSHVHGGSVRRHTRSRYRQWLLHKLSTWYDQFGRSGCVGCGRCITWCPIGIDITAEAHRISGTKRGAP